MGPRELDIACLPAEAWPYCGDVDDKLLARCADLKSVCVAVWCSAGTARDVTALEAADYHLNRVRRFVV